MTRLKEPNRRHPPWSYNEDLQQSITGMNNCVLHILNVLPIDKGEMSLIAHNLRPLIRTPPLEGGIICVTINLDGGTISPLIKKNLWGKYCYYQFRRRHYQFRRRQRSHFIGGFYRGPSDRRIVALDARSQPWCAGRGLITIIISIIISIIIIIMIIVMMTIISSIISISISILIIIIIISSSSSSGINIIIIIINIIIIIINMNIISVSISTPITITIIITGIIIIVITIITATSLPKYRCLWKPSACP